MSKNNLMDQILCIFFSVAKKGLLILCIGLICGITFDVGRTITYKPQYKASLTALVQSKDHTYEQLAGTRSYIKTMEYVFNGDVAREYIRKDLDLPSLNIDCSISSGDNTNFVEISVLSDSKQSAYYSLRSLIEWNNTVTTAYKNDYTLSIIKNATYEDTPVNINHHSINFGIGFIAGGILTAAILTFFEILRNKVRTVNDVHTDVTARLYGEIPKEKKKSGKFFWKRNRDGILITSVTTSFAYKEAVTKLRRKLEASSHKHNYKTIMVTSTAENETKTTLVTNLSISFAQKGYKVLLVDLDTIKPSVYKILNLDNTKKNLNNYMDGKCSWQSQIQHYNLFSLDVLTTVHVTDNPENYLDSENIERMLYEAKSEYDFIFIDSAPAGHLSDAIYINKYADASLIVIRQGFTVISLINETIHRLRNSKDNLVGCVYCSNLSDLTRKHKLYNYGYNNYYSKESET